MIGGLLLGWIMGLFGFKGVMIAGMSQLFGVTLTSLGYYFIFAMIGLVTSLIRLFRGKNSTVEVKLNEFFKDSKNLKKK